MIVTGERRCIPFNIGNKKKMTNVTATLQQCIGEVLIKAIRKEKIYMLRVLTLFLPIYLFLLKI